VALVVLDTSAVIAYLNPADALHRRAVAALSAHQVEQLILPASAYAEALVGPHRAGGAALATFDEALAAIGIRVEPLNRNAARRAGLLRSQHAALRLPDALVLATADELDATTVLTGDAAWLKISTRVRIL